MKRYLIPTIIILVLASGLLSSCGEKGALTEKQVIQMTYDYLITKARQLQGAAQAKDIIIGALFRKAVLGASQKAVAEDDMDKLGELVYMQFDGLSPGQPEALKTLTWEGALKKLAKYQGDGLWLVFIEDWEWEFNERTGEVIAQNEEAVKLLEEITLKTYYNSRYGYYLDYPPSWSVNDKDMSEVWIYPSSPEASEAYIFIHVISEEELSAFKGLLGYISTKLSLLQSQCYEFEVTEATPPRIDYTYRLLKDSPRHEAKRYFVQHGSNVFEIVCSAELTAFVEYYSLSPLYDPFDSFRFQP